MACWRKLASMWLASMSRCRPPVTPMLASPWLVRGPRALEPGLPQKGRHHLLDTAGSQLRRLCLRDLRPQHPRQGQVPVCREDLLHRQLPELFFVPVNTEYAEAIAIARLDVFPMPTASKAPLAPGVHDLATWSKTLFELPKYRDLKLSYKGLLTKAWDDVNMLSYIRWIGSTYAQEARNPKAGKASDFAAYLLAVKFPAAERQKEIDGRRRTLVEE